MKEIRTQDKSVRTLLGEKYSVDSYQREYKWEEKQIDDLVDDLLAAFAEDYKDGHERDHVRNYGQYFLGPIIVSTGNGKQYIVDGQQRLTTLTLALICLLRMTDIEGQKKTYNLSCTPNHMERNRLIWMYRSGPSVYGDSMRASYLMPAMRQNPFVIWLIGMNGCKANWKMD